jgi:hypothetical protein
MNVKIYTVHHAVPGWYMANDVFVPFIVGEIGEGPLDPAFQTDREAPTLSDQHSFAEMRCHYWVWKHMPDIDYVGFQHYRRAFASALIGGRFAEVRAAAETFVRRDLSLTTRWITGLLDHCDIIVPRKWPAQPDLGADYANSHSAADWQVLLSALPSPELASGIDYLYRANMFVMRADLFDEYMANWWLPIMQTIAARMTPPEGGYQSRTFGFMSERLFTMWIARLQREAPMRIIELPLMVGIFTAI